ncbi:N-acetylgalactosamine-6-phosphate deacetylase [Microbulbifer donghaiensis]|uniref:N-acetylgalactosamine-6-phosphate deacetylase n=1 Tax=Microbulbifer donghaiensis TaxID=494016 RepID=A0A1M5CIJ0_9GAMM|nr:N-acetylglucosamine-6-phosphate deacetylase [Microbulbifer donghaiensis]SHF54417.1 N-acetylgalactosamine-6-phosphate deacetylase [Microbulbifer donghaiensis]
MKATNCYLQASRIITETEDLLDHCLRIEHGRITDIARTPGSDLPLISLPDATLIPGMIDLHIHGREGCDVMDATPAAIDTISTSLARHGVTGFLATTVTSSWEETLAAMENLGNAALQTQPGAQVLGGYSEGLFFASEHKGAHNEHFFLTPTRERIDALLEAARGQLKVVALAPEVEGAMEIIPYLKEKGVRVMLGHTSATYDQTAAALQAGACGGVHVFNGMRGIHHREPGCTGAVLMHDANVEVIADGVHLHPVILQMICKLKETRQVTLISDCINAGGLRDGRYTLGKMEVELRQGVARTDSGSLAGSTLTLEKAVANLQQLAGIALREAVHMASLSPAIFLGIDHRTGSIAKGKDADIAILDGEGNVRATLYRGDLIYCDENISSQFKGHLEII